MIEHGAIRLNRFEPLKPGGFTNSSPPQEI
jgi:hypothetical protein